MSLLYGCETLLVGGADERMTASVTFYMKHRDCIPTVEVWCRLRFTCIPAQLVQRRLCWFSHTVKRLDGELSFVHGVSGLEAS